MGLEVDFLSCWSGGSSRADGQGVIYDQIHISSVGLFHLISSRGGFSNLQSLRHNMSLLHISWRLEVDALDLFHQIYSMASVFPFFFVGNPILFCRGSFHCCRHFSLAHHLPKSLSLFSGRRLIRNRKPGRKDGKVFIFRAILCHCTDFLKQLLWYLFQPSNPEGNPWFGVWFLSNFSL